MLNVVQSIVPAKLSLVGSDINRIGGVANACMAEYIYSYSP